MFEEAHWQDYFESNKEIKVGYPTIIVEIDPSSHRARNNKALVIADLGDKGFYPYGSMGNYLMGGYDSHLVDLEHVNGVKSVWYEPAEAYQR